MKKGKSLLVVLLLALLLWDTALPVRAAQTPAADTYMIRIYAGQQGEMIEASGGKGVIAGDGRSFILNGVRYGETVVLSQVYRPREDGAADGYNYFDLTVQLGEKDDPDMISTIRFRTAEKYNVIGFRDSGKDNGERIGSVKIEYDRDIVVAYGLMKNAVDYTIHYVDTEGNTLREKRDCRGVIGDKPVIPYQYIEGYQPQAYNLTKTLSDKPEENVFTFVYSRMAPPEVIVITVPGPSAPPAPELPPEEEEQGVVVVVPPEGGGGGGEEQGGIEIEEEITPQGPPQEILDLDDQQTPLGDGGLEDDDKNGAIGIFSGNALLINMPLPVKIGAVVLFVLLLAGGLWMLLFRRKNEEDVEEGPGEENGSEEGAEEENGSGEVEESEKEKRSEEGSGDEI